MNVLRGDRRLRFRPALLPRQALMAVVRGYRLLLSPWLGASCRFEPSCSTYALQALERHGAAAGSYLSVKRIGRCHPWCEAGYDPVPKDPPALFTAFFGARLEADAGSPPTSRENTSP